MTDTGFKVKIKVDDIRASVEEVLENLGFSDALDDVLEERMRQDEIWGVQNRDPFTYLTILVEEVGEFAQAALHSKFGGEESDNMRNEAVQIAAVALAMVECIDRDEWSWPDE